MVASGKAERSGVENEALFSYFLRREEKEALFLTFFGAKKEAKKHPPPPSRPLYGAGVTDSGGMPPYVRVLVWLAKPVPYGRAMVFYTSPPAPPLEGKGWLRTEE